MRSRRITPSSLLVVLAATSTNLTYEWIEVSNQPSAARLGVEEGAQPRCTTVASEVRCSTIRSRERGSGRLNVTMSLFQSRQSDRQNGTRPIVERRVSQPKTALARAGSDCQPGVYAQRQTRIGRNPRRTI